MDLLCLNLAGIISSLNLWGILRTAFLLLPTLFFPDLLPVFSASFLSFFVSGCWLAPYEAGAFDFRDLDRSRTVLIFFAAGVGTGLLLFPPHLAAMGIGSILPIIYMKLFELIRQPVPRIWIMPRWTPWLLTIVWILVGTVRWLSV